MQTLKELREHYCLTQLEVMQAIGMKGRANYSTIEHKRQKPHMAMRRKIAEYFKVNPWDIDW
jgi:transcriptional regulator with XRE-family HTH domain